MTKRYRIKNFALGGEKIERIPQLSVSSTTTWKKMLVEEALKREMSLSHFVRSACDHCIDNGVVFEEKE